LNFAEFVTEDLSTGFKLNYGLVIDSVTFDNSEDPNFSNNNAGIRDIQVDTLTGTSVGNVTISNSQFLNSHIY